MLKLATLHTSTKLAWKQTNIQSAQLTTTRLIWCKNQQLPTTSVYQSQWS